MDSCSPCSSLDDLWNAADAHLAYSVPVGSVILETSLNAPLSAFLQLTSITECPYGYCETWHYFVPVTPDDMGTAALDNALFSRAIDVPPLQAASGYYWNTEDAVIEGWLGSAAGFPWTGQFGTSVWHGLTNFPQFEYFVLLDSQTGQQVKVYPGDTVTVVFPDGYSRKYQLTAPGGEIAWTYVPGTLMQNGQCLDCTAPTQTSTPVGPTSGSYAYNGGNGSTYNLYTYWNNACFISGYSCVSFGGGECELEYYQYSASCY